MDISGRTRGKKKPLLYTFWYFSKYFTVEISNFAPWGKNAFTQWGSRYIVPFEFHVYPRPVLEIHLFSWDTSMFWIWLFTLISGSMADVGLRHLKIIIKLSICASSCEVWIRHTSYSWKLPKVVGGSSLLAERKDHMKAIRGSGEKTGGICLQSGRMGPLIREQGTEWSIEETAAATGICLTFVSQVEIYLGMSKRTNALQSCTSSSFLHGRWL